MSTSQHTGTDPTPDNERDFVNTESGVYPTGEIWEREQWMARQGKLPFAADGHRDDPAHCRKHGGKASECDCDARFKWSHDEFYRAGEQARDDAYIHPDCDGVAFIQQGDDPYLLADGDDVIDPETGAVHPGFVALLRILGATYTDVSTSWSGAHGIYRGDTPDGVTEPVIDLDDEPWGSNDEIPQVEIYATTRVCVTTGEHVPGTPTDIRSINNDAFRAVLDANGDLPVEDTCSRTVDSDSDSDRSDSDENPDRTPNPDVTVTTNPDDVYAAIDALDNEDVAEATIVDTWTSRSSPRSFLPTWGDPGDGGTANYVGETGWFDGGDESGRGGPVQMAAIDAGIIKNTQSDWGVLDREEWIEAVDHLRSLGFSIPEYVESDEEAYVAVARRYAVDDRDPLRDDTALLLACLAARDDDAVPDDAVPPRDAVTPIARSLFDAEFDELRDARQGMVMDTFDAIDVDRAKEVING